MTKQFCFPDSLKDVQVSFKFIPASKVEGGGAEKFNYEMIFKRGTRTRVFPYSMGCGHSPSYQTLFPSKIAKRRVMEWECENGRVCPTSIRFALINGRSGYLPPSSCKPIVPNLGAALWCLMVDAEVLDYPGFEEWVGDFGYDADSRAAEKIYQTCLQQSLALKSLFTEQEWLELKEEVRRHEETA